MNKWSWETEIKVLKRLCSLAFVQTCCCRCVCGIFSGQIYSRFGLVFGVCTCCVSVRVWRFRAGVSVHVCVFLAFVTARWRVQSSFCRKGKLAGSLSLCPLTYTYTHACLCDCHVSVMSGTHISQVILVFLYHEVCGLTEHLTLRWLKSRFSPSDKQSPKSLDHYTNLSDFPMAWGLLRG